MRLSLMVIGIGVLICVSTPASAVMRKMDGPNMGYCPNGVRVDDLNKCNRDTDGRCKPGRTCKPLPSNRTEELERRMRR